MAKGKAKQRGVVNKADILDAAFALFENKGEDGFSVRKVAAEVRVDPMTVLHHFGSKRELLRAIADRAVNTVVIPEGSDDWRGDLMAIATAYRELALRHPRVFRLHFVFHATGPADHRAAEIVYRALLRAGRTRHEAAGLGLAFYAFVLGFALSEAEGLLKAIDEADEAELLALPEAEFPATRSLVPEFKRLEPAETFELALGIWLDGLVDGSRAGDGLAVVSPAGATGRSAVRQALGGSGGEGLVARKR